MSLVTRALISRALDSFEQAAIIVIGGNQERATQIIGDRLRQFVDDLCPERPRIPKPIPWPWGDEFDATLLDPTSLLAAGAQFERVARTIGEHPLQTVLADAATRLFETGVARLENAE
jgi:hypothetical protein